MADEGLRLAEDSQSYCRLVDPAGGPVKVPIIELTAQTSLLGTKLSFMPNDYLDVTLQLRGAAPKAMFAHVVSVEGDNLRVRWLHFDPSDEAKLKVFLTAFASGTLGPKDKAPDPQASPTPAEAAEASATRQGTRRIVRPSQVFTPFSKGDAQPDIDPKLRESIKPVEGAAERHGTRRVVRPSARMESSEVDSTAPSGDAPAAKSADGPGFDSSGAHMVIAPTAQFKKFSDVQAKVDNPVSTETAGNAKMVVGADGKMDIGATIRSKAKTIRASELAARHDKVRVLNMGTIKLLIQDAVSEAMVHISSSIGDTEKKRLLEEAEAQFQERLKTFQAEKAGAQEYAKQLNDQLRRAQQLLEDERKRAISADQFTVSESGMGQIEEKMKRVLEYALRTGDVSAELEAKLREMISHILDDERERIRKQEQEAQGAKIDLLEKKIKRLAGNLEESERQREEAQALANALEQQGGGLRNIMAAGIGDKDAAKKRKLALMKEILDINRKIRDELGVAYNRDDAAVAKLDEVRAKLPDAPWVNPGDDDKVEKRAAGDPAAGNDAAEDAGMEASADGPAEIDPDDMAWEVKEITIVADEERDEKKAGIKRFAANSKPAPARKPGG